MVNDWEVTDDEPQLAPQRAPGEGVEGARLLMPGGRTEHLEIVEGATVAELLAQVPAELHEFVDVFNHGMRIADWQGVRLRRGDRVLITVTPQGKGGRGKSIVGAILMIVVAIVAPYAAPYVAGPLVGVLGEGGALLAAQFAITMVAGMVISALVKPPSVGTGDNAVGIAGAKSYSLTGQSNQPRAYNSCLVIYGQHKVMPAMATNPNVDNWQAESRMTALYDFGLGYVNFYDIRIGDVPVGEYSPRLVTHTNSYCDDLQLMSNRIGYDQYALVLNRNDPVTVRTKPDSFSADLDINYPKGIFQASPTYGALPFWADYAAYWRKVGTEPWQWVPIDWYSGAASRSYESSRTGIQYGLEGYLNWTDYRPATAVNEMREVASQYFAANPGAAPTTAPRYVDAVRNPSMVFSYPNGPMNESDYLGRYPEIRAAGWTRSGVEHFESIGSRESRNPGVPALINGGTYYNTDQSVGGSAYILHQYDRMNTDNRNVGGWWWIDNVGRLTGVVEEDRATRQAPWKWRIYDSGAWDGATYLNRYPDVARAGVDPWEHFTQFGAFEGRDPYPWQIDAVVRLTSNYVGSYWNRIHFTFPEPGEYELRVMRLDKIEDGQDVSISTTTGGAITARYNESTLVLLRSYQWGLTVKPRFRHTMLEMQVTATDQLQGVVQNLSAIAISVLPVTNDGGNFWWAETRNPAWIALDILTSEKNPKPLTRQQIDWPSWLRLVAYCDAPRTYVFNGLPYTAPRFVCDIVIDSFSTVKDLVESILSQCRASMILTQSGTWGVLIDEDKTFARQLLTPANSWSFSGARSFTQLPHALRVNFINRDNGYNKDETLVYWDGYSEANATVFETLETYGVTDYAHAWAYGRYMLAQGIQRSELFTVTMDVENLLVTRGDLVTVAHDAPRIGGVPFRVVRVDAAQNAVEVDGALAAFPSGYAVRTASNGWQRTGRVVNILSDRTFVLDTAAAIEPDDLIVLGEFDRVIQPYLVQRITPGANLTAELTLCKYAPGVYQADQGALPPWDAGISHDYLNGTDLASINLVAVQTLYYLERNPRVKVQLTWSTSGWGLHHHVVTVRSPSGESKTLSDTAWQMAYDWDIDALSEREWFDVTLQFKVTPVNSQGFEGSSTYTTIVLLRDTTAPRAVIAFGANVQKENVDLFWTADADVDIAAYMIRYTPQAEYPSWEASTEVARVAWPGSKTSVGARTGSYGIRVIDTSGNVGAVVWRRTTVAVLPDINVITAINDRDLFPVRWPGVKSHVVAEGNELRTEGEFGEVYPLGIYYCSYPVDLGDVYEARLSSKIEAYGTTADDYMVNWVPSLADVPAMSHASTALWDAWAEVRVSNELDVIADWPTLSSVATMAGANEGQWSAWRSFMVGDFTGRLFQFRIILQSKNPGVRVYVSSGRIEVDMPDRIDSYRDVQVSASGLDFFFTVPFRELQSLAITIDGNAAPVVAKVTNKNALGFHLQLINTTTSAAVAGQVDIMAEGYGRQRITSI